MKLMKSVFFAIMLVLPVFVLLNDAVAASPTFDAKALAEKAVNNELSEEFIKSLSYDEFESVEIEVAMSAGAERGAIENFLHENRKSFQKNFYAHVLDISTNCSSVASSGGTISALTTGSCRQDVETSIAGSGATYASSWAYDWYCDEDPSDAEYRLDYYPSWNVDPDRVRWYSYNNWINFVFYQLYGSNLTGLSLCGNPKSLCIGDNGVFAAGGIGIVSSSVFIWYR